ncbi:major capsid protein [Sporolactobacillus terrae]|uniref:Coat protein n=1 Tax=Sporolactobacillus terrae TaxID=269673 RepID=A0A5K7WT26_9BACL|nr:major capsid protein [Sporolactobacillus terrae]BBN97497.1 coat protein [Sporolactobacillus terrae]
MGELKYKLNIQYFAKTQIQDVIVPEVFNPYVVQRTAELSALRRSGIISNNSELDRLASSGGRLINMPFWDDLTGDDEVLSDSGALTPQKITASQDVAVLLMRGKAWSANDLAKALSGDDPMRAIGDLVAEYWVRMEQKTLISILDGVFADNAANDDSDLVHNIATEDGDAAAEANKLSPEAIIDAATLLGDAAGKLTAIAVHSAVYANMQKQNLIDFEPTNTQNIGWGTYLGKTLIVDDGLTPVNGTESGKKYKTILFGQGAIGLGNGAAPVPTETDRDSLAGDDILINRRHYILHPRGIKFTDSSVADSSPTNAELANAENWDRVYEKKNIRLVELVTNG